MQRRHADERKGPGAGLHFVAGINVVFEQHRDAVQRAQNSAVPPQHVGILCHHQRVGINFNNSIDARAVLVESDDASQIIFRQFLGSEVAGSHLSLQLGHGSLVESVWNSMFVFSGQS